MGMIMHDDVPYGEGTSYTQGTGIAINNNIIAVDADNAPTENSEKPVKSKGVYEVVEQIYADNGVLGVKNLWDESHSFNTKTGVTYTLTDHIYTINTAAEDYSGIYIGKTVARQYYSNYVGVRAKMVFEIKGDGTFNVQTLNNVVTSVSTEYKRVEIPISDLSQIDDIVFYNRTTTAHTITVKNLMIVLASDPDDTYVPYAMTNREITEELTVQESAVTDIISGVVDNVIGNHLYKYGKVVTLSIRLNNCTMSEWGDPPVFKIPSGYRPISPQRVIDIFDIDITARAKRSLQINPNGNALCSKAITDGMVCFYATWITQ